jgi:hypothetical protein
MTNNSSDHKRLRKFSEIGTRKIMLAVLSVAAILRLLSIILIRNYAHPNTWEFGEIAHNMLLGHGFAMRGDIPSAHMPPLYCYLFLP